MILEPWLIALAGVISPFVTGWLKKLVGWEEKAAFLLTVLVCFVLALVAVVISGKFSWTDLGTSGVMVFTIATALYKLILK